MSIVSSCCLFFLGRTFPVDSYLFSVRQLEREEVIVSFTDSGHAGDKRKRSQACNLSQSVIHMLGALSMVVSMFFLEQLLSRLSRNKRRP